MASKFKATVVSNEYINAVADSAATGKPIAYSGVVASSTVFTDEQLKTLDYTGAQNANKEVTSAVTSSYLKQGSNTIVIEVNLSNENLSTDFQWASVLIYATYNGNNILVAVLRLVTPELFPAYDGKSIVSVGVDLFISVDKTAAANISVNGAGYATMDTVNKLRNYVDNDFNATIIRSDKDGVLNGSYSFSKQINALGGVNGFTKVRPIPTGTTTIKSLIENFISEVSSDVFANVSYMAYHNSFSDSPFGSSYLFIRLTTRGLRTYVEVFDENNNVAFTNYVSGSFLTWRMYADSATSVHNIYDENINGIKTFIKQIIAQAGVKGNLQGNADTATKLATARKLGGQPFDGTSDVTLPGVNAIGNQDTTGNAATASTAAGSDKLNTGRNISVTGDVTAPAQKFDGTKDLALAASLPTITRNDTSSSSSVGYGGTITVIDSVVTDSKGRITGLNVSKIAIPDSQTTVTGNAGSATKLQIARKIAGVSFDGTQDIDLAGVNKTGNQDTTGKAARSDVLNTRYVTFTDFADVAGNMITYSGNWRNGSTVIENSPVSGMTYMIIEVVPDSGGTAGIIRVAQYGNKKAYYNVVNGGKLGTWFQYAVDSNIVHNTGSENISGAKNFFDVLTAKSGIVGNVTGDLKGNAATADVLNVRSATFTDISVVTADMITYSGNWAINSSKINGIPSIGYAVMEVLPGGGNKTAGIIRMSSTSGGVIANYIGLVRNGSQLSWVLLSDDSTVVHNSGNETIGGSKTFSSTINGNLNGNSTTSTKLQTARTIGGVSFDGTQNINLPGVNTAGNQNTSGKAATAGRADTAAKADSATTANDPNALHQSGNESASGTKTFTGTLVANNPINGVLSIANLSQKDLNSATVNGRYKIDTTYSNIPTMMPNGAFLDVMNFDDNLIYQVIVARDFSDKWHKSTMWIRMRISGSWGDWEGIAKDVYVVHNIADETISGDKTFTGTIIANNAIKLTSNSVSQAYTSSVNGLTFSLNRVGNTIMAQLYGKPSVKPGFGVTLATFTSSDIPFGYRLPNITGIQIYGSGDLQLSSDVIRLEKSPNSDDLKIVWRTNHSVQDFIDFSFTWATIDDMPTNN